MVMKNYSSMKKMFLVGVSMIALLVVTTAPLRAEEEKPTGDFTTAVLNKYVWRGYELSRNSVVIQPSMTVGYKGFSANFWGNLDTRAYDAGTTGYTGTWNETDLTLSYSRTLGPVNVGGGYIYYSLASLNKDAADRPDSQELFVTVSLNALLTPTLTVYKEVDHYRNWYFLLGISHVIELNNMVSLKLAASAGYLLSTDAGTYPKFDSNALATTDKFSNFHDGSVSASFPVKVSKYVTITPTASYIFPLSGAAQDEMKGMGLKGATAATERDSSFFVGGILASLTF
jgi:hypothetical protein